MPRLPSILAPLALVLLCTAALAEDPPAGNSDQAPTEGNEQPAEKPVERVPLDERSEEDAKALEQRLPLREQQRLGAGSEQFLALWRPANVAEPYGVVILLPGDGENADWPRAIAPLRTRLPDVGWHTLSLTLPDPAGDEPPPRPAGTSLPAASEGSTPAEPPKSESADPADPPPPTEQAGTTEPSADPPPPQPTAEERRKAQTERIAARIQAAVDFGRQQQATTVVLLGHGTGAWWAARFLTDNPSSGIENLVMVAADVPAGYEPPLEELATRLPQAVGDLYYQEVPAAAAAALKRLQASRRVKHLDYVQVPLANWSASRDAKQEQLLRRVRGWLDNHLGRAAPKSPVSGGATAPTPPIAPPTPTPSI
ncbi:alpha/beta hydrolase family protein [Metapseudomonas otitidis]|uniref:alpha/beta hydrolase family protein n=1 Tax=Metapseudomonas otitidis TaxID=319939 RepID=UPI0013F5FA84|nr:alpha/beta hydrolase family protein [Pseudomonas otitidis]